MSPSLELAQTMDNFRKRSKNETNDDIDIYFNETRRMTIWECKRDKLVIRTISQLVSNQVTAITLCAVNSNNESD